MRRTAGLALSTLVALAGCGGLESPDLETGTVAGRVTNTLAGAYVYAFGRADLRAAVAADGSFSIEDVPVETAAVVVVDGEADDLTHRAKMIPVHVEGAQRTDAGTVDASAMPLAGTVVATVQLDGGAAPGSPAFSLVGTERENVVAAIDTVELEPIPEGTFVLAASMDGFREVRLSVDVRAGQRAWFTLALEPDLAAESPGCLATSCRSAALMCAGDGNCYECLLDGDCDGRGNGYTCDPALHVCRTAATGAAGAMCEACGDGQQCAGGVCVQYGTSGYCSRGCTVADSCPAGFDCQGNVCLAPDGCAAYFAVFGAACLDDSACRSLNGGTCQGESTGPVPAAGYCTAQCITSADCIAPGYRVCDAISGLCVP